MDKNDKELQKAMNKVLKMMAKDIPLARLVELHKQNSEMSDLIANEMFKEKDDILTKKVINFYEQVGELYKDFIIEFLGEDILKKIEE